MNRVKAEQKKRRRSWGFTLTEIAMVTALVTSVPAASYVRVKKKAYQIQCTNNMKQLHQLLFMYVQTEGYYPKAAFYPEDPRKSSDSIRVILGGDQRLWTCPSMPPPLQKKGLSFVYNDSLAGKRSVRDATRKWVLIEVTCVSKKVPMPHPGGYNILFADGHVISSKVLPKKITAAQKAQIRRIEDRIRREQYAHVCNADYRKL